jgi:tetratricopeptide (TPR) repeat protein
MLGVLRFHLALVLISAAAFAQSVPDASPTVPDSKPVNVSTPNPLGEARTLYRKGDFSGAIAKYQEILKEQPKSPDAYAGLVRVYLKQKNVEQAAETAELGLSHSDSPRIHVARAEVWFRQGRITDAEKEWVEVLKGGHPEARAYLGLSRVRHTIAMYKTAKRMIEKAHELDLSDPDIQEQWAGTLPRAERIKYLENSLAGENNWNADERQNVKTYLEYLKEKANQKNGRCRLVTKLSASEMPLVRMKYDPEHLRGYGLTVALNGHKSDLLLDTGAGGIVVKRSIAEHAGISKIIETKIGGIGDRGTRKAFVGMADSIKIGELEFQNCPITVQESFSVAGEDGLIGVDMFEHFLVDLDFPHEKLKLSELPKRPGEAEQNAALNSEDDDEDDSAASDPGTSNGNATDVSKNEGAKTAAPTQPSPGPQDRYIAPEMQPYTRVFRFGHFLLVPTSIGKVPAKLFVLDTGAFNNAIAPGAAREVSHVDESLGSISGVSGEVKNIYSAHKAILEFGHLKQTNQELTAFDTTRISDDVGTEISGFLGFVMLRFIDIKIDYRDALVDFEFDPKFWHMTQ